jgi:phospholipid/cholesterol/gamma-HCH transport system permease protein
MYFIAFFSQIGEKALQLLKVFKEGVYFSVICIFHLLSYKSYNSATTMVLIKQIYFTTVQLLPLFILMAVIFGSTIIGAIISLAISFGLEEQIGSIIVTFSLDEFSTLFTALLISLRSGAAVSTEIAVMSLNKELDFLKAYKINLINYLFLPRIISGILSMITLSILFCFIMLLGGYIITYFLLGIDYNTYFMLLFNSMEIKNFLFLFIKSIIFGFIVMIIPIYSGLKAKESYTQIPIAVLQGMVKLFIAIFMVEVVSLILQFI